MGSEKTPNVGMDSRVSVGGWVNNREIFLQDDVTVIKRNTNVVGIFKHNERMTVIVF